MDNDPTYNDFDIHKEFESLSQTLSLFEEKFSKDLSILLNSTRSSEMQIQISKEEVMQLEKTLDKNRQESKKKADVLKERTNKLHELKATYSEINSEVNDMIHKKETMEKDLQMVLQQISNEKEAISKQDKNTKWKLSEFEKARNWFCDTLGLKFQKTSNNRIQIIFTYINHRKPIKRYMFFIKISENGAYTVSDCTPTIPHLDELVTELNASNNLSNFILAVRKAFKDMCLH